MIMSARTTVSRRIFGVSLAFVVSVVCAPVLAQGWEVSPSIYASVLATDNIGLAPDALKESDTSYELSPQLVLSREGPRLQLNSRYRMQARRFEDNSQNDQIFHNLNLSSNLDGGGRSRWRECVGQHFATTHRPQPGHRCHDRQPRG